MDMDSCTGVQNGNNVLCGRLWNSHKEPVRVKIGNPACDTGLPITHHWHWSDQETFKQNKAKATHALSQCSKGASELLASSTAGVLREIMAQMRTKQNCPHAGHLIHYPYTHTVSYTLWAHKLRSLRRLLCFYFFYFAVHYTGLSADPNTPLGYFSRSFLYFSCHFCELQLEPCQYLTSSQCAQTTRLILSNVHTFKCEAEW